MVAAVRSGCVVFGALALIFLTRCSTARTEDGAACLDSQECASRRCTGGFCEGSDCTCEGSDCRGRSSCLEGWLCTRSDTVTAVPIPVCRRQCTGAGTCASGEHCSRGVCQVGGESFVITWLSFPRAVGCAAGVPCTYKVKVSEGTTVDTFTWTFGAAGHTDTREPTVDFTYPKTATYAVHVHAVAKSGATADLDANEVLCEGGRGAFCDASGAPCCEGSCNAKSTCQ